MTQEKSKTLDGMPSIAPSRDDIETRRTSRRTDTVSSRSRSSAAGVVANLVMAILIAGLTACGWFIATQNDALATARAERGSAQDRLLRIERRLSLTDEAMNQSDAQTQDKLSFWEDEIRKLWDISNKRNRDWIEENQAALVRLEQSLGAQSQSMAEISAEATDLRRAIGTQEQILEQLMLLDRRAADLLRQQRTLTDSMNTLEQTSGAMVRRVDANEEAIEAIDAFRRDVIARLTRMQERLDAASGARSGSGGTVTPTVSPTVPPAT